MAHRQFRLAVSLERVTVHWPCIGFAPTKSGYMLHFLGDRRVRVPASLLRAGRLAPPLDKSALIEIYGAVPLACAFCLQVTSAVYRHELARRSSDDSSPRRDDVWCSLSPQPSPRCASPGVFSMDSDSELDVAAAGDEPAAGGEAPCLPTSGRFGLLTVGTLDIAPLADAVDDATPVHWAGAVRGTAGGSTFDECAAKLDARLGEFSIESQQLRLQCTVTGEMRDDHFVLMLASAFLHVPATTPVASVFAAAADE